MNTINNGPEAGAPTGTSDTSFAPGQPRPEGNSDADGATVAAPTRGTIPPSWSARSLIQSRPVDRISILGQRLSSPGDDAITWHLAKKGVNYGIGTYASSFTDRGDNLAFGKRLPKVNEIDAALMLAVHKIETGAWSGPVTIGGTPKFKGAVLARAVELNIVLGNPELANLQDALRLKAGLPPIDDSNRVFDGRNATTAKTTQATDNGAGPAAAPANTSPQPQTPAPAVVPVPADNVAADLRAVATKALGTEFDADKITERTTVPASHGTNAVRMYSIVAADAREIAVSFRDGSYMIVPRTQGTAEAKVDSFVLVRTNQQGEITTIHPHEDTSVIVVPTSSHATDPEVVFRNAVPTELTGHALELNQTLLDSDARTALLAENIASAKIKEIPFAMPTRNATITVLARNDSGFALKMTNFGQFAIVDPSVTPLPDVPAGGQIAFRTVDGVMRAMDTATAKKVDALRPKTTVSAA